MLKLTVTPQAKGSCNSLGLHLGQHCQF